jgi:hypothetical protein
MTRVWREEGGDNGEAERLPLSSLSFSTKTLSTRTTNITFLLRGQTRVDDTIVDDHEKCMRLSLLHDQFTLLCHHGRRRL